MKKFCLFGILVVLLLCTVTTTALAASSTVFKNIKLSPAEGAHLQGRQVSWSCSGTLTLQKESGDWITKLINPTYYQKVSVELYSLVEKQGAFTWNGYTTVTEEQFEKTLYSKNYNDKYEVTFSANGALFLSPGSYRIKIIATLDQRTGTPFTKLVEENDFTVAEKTALVTVRCVNSSTNEILRSTQEVVSEGGTAFNAPAINGYTAVWPSYQKVSLLNDGTVSPSIVIFKYVKDSSVGNSNNYVTARVTVEGVNAVTNEVLYREYKDLKPGTTTIAARNLSDAYYFSGASSENVYVSQDGTAGQSVVRFYYTPKTTTGNGGSTGAGSYVTTPPVITQPPHHGNSNSPYNIGVPNLNGKVYYENDMNVHVLWVHYQLKATGQYYQGDNWDETGNLGNTTMKEIARFMKANGHPNHNGRVDQTVINTFANYLGNRVVPIYAGGYYDKMNTIMSGGSAGSMQSIDEYSSSTKIKWVQTCLKKLGYYTSSIDGKFGSGTINALKRFQSDYGYVQRDYVSLGVARAMLEACYNRGCSLDDLP